MDRERIVGLVVCRSCLGQRAVKNVDARGNELEKQEVIGYGMLEINIWGSLDFDNDKI